MPFFGFEGAEEMAFFHTAPVVEKKKSLQTLVEIQSISLLYLSTSPTNGMRKGEKSFTLMPLYKYNFSFEILVQHHQSFPDVSHIQLTEAGYVSHYG